MATLDDALRARREPRRGGERRRLPHPRARHRHERAARHRRRQRARDGERRALPARRHRRQPALGRDRRARRRAARARRHRRRRGRRRRAHGAWPSSRAPPPSASTAWSPRSAARPTSSTASRRHLAGAPLIADVTAGRDGFVAGIDTRGLGLAVVELGGGRRRASDAHRPRRRPREPDRPRRRRRARHAARPRPRRRRGGARSAADRPRPRRLPPRTRRRPTRARSSTTGSPDAARLPPRDGLGRLRRRPRRRRLRRRGRQHPRPHRRRLRRGPRRRGPLAARCTCRTWPRLGLGAAIRAASRDRPARLPRDPGGGLGRRHRGLARQGHPLRPLGARRRPGALGLALLPEDRPGDPALGHRAADRARRPPRHALQRPLLRHAGASAPSARSTSRRASRSSTPRPTACCRSPRTRRTSASSASTRPAGSPRRSCIRCASAGSSPGPSSARRAASFVRTANRRDLAIPPPEPTILDRVVAAGGRTHAIGKIGDIFAHRGISTLAKGKDDMALVDATLAAIDAAGDGDLVFANYVDFDTPLGPPARRRRLRPRARGLRRAPARGHRPPARRRPADPHRRPRQRPDLARHRPHPRARAGARHRPRPRRRARPARSASPTSARPSPPTSASRPGRHGRSFL